jgi:hypothetical protein
MGDDGVDAGEGCEGAAGAGVVSLTKRTNPILIVDCSAFVKDC